MWNRRTILVVGTLIALGAGVFYLWHCGRPAPSPAGGGTRAGQPTPIDLTAAEREREDSTWGEFRRAYPFHVQALAVTNPWKDGWRTLIVSEPPPYVTLEGLESVAPATLAKHQVKTHTVGHDGWVKDIVFEIPPGIDLKKLKEDLSQDLFGTPYGAYALPLPVNTDSLGTRYPLDLHVGLSDLEKWGTVDEYAGPDGKPVGKLSAVRGGGVFFDSTSDVVAWLIPAEEKVDSVRGQIRRFALDTDLILGAVRLPNASVAVLGRERVVPVDVMPPLRGETVCLLAAAETDKLAQSYERTSPLAGKYNGIWDWAPAYLSPQLLDTEYGSLLNIADQLLKSWTEHGEARYQNFPYADPPVYPFEQPLVRELQTDQLLFNWNTTGVGYTAQVGSATIYGLGRTGALPVIYRPGKDEDMPTGAAGQKVRDAEEAGYDYYSSLGEPVLARVVQYAALYQCFRAFDVRATSVPATVAGNTSEYIEGEARASLNALQQADDASLHARVESRADERAALGSDAATQPSALAQFERALDAAEIEQGFKELRDAARQCEKSAGPNGVGYAVQVVCAPRGTDVEKLIDGWQITEDGGKAVVDFILALRDKMHVLAVWADLDHVRRGFSAAHGHGSQAWMHTQSIVVSCNVGGSVGGTGGHNLDAKVTSLISSADVPRGSAKVLEDGRVAVNPEDLAHSPDLIRLIARERNNANLPHLVAQQLAEASAKPHAAEAVELALGDRPLRTSRGFGGGHVPPPEEPGIGKTPPPGDRPDGIPPPGTDPPPGGPPKTPPMGAGPLGPSNLGPHELPMSALFVERRGGKVYLYRKTEGGVLRAESWNVHDAHMAVIAELRAGARTRDGAPLELHLGEGFDTPASRDAFVGSLSVQAARYPEADPILLFGKLSPEVSARLKVDWATFVQRYSASHVVRTAWRS